MIWPVCRHIFCHIKHQLKSEMGSLAFRGMFPRVKYHDIRFVCTVCICYPFSQQLQCLKWVFVKAVVCSGVDFTCGLERME